MIIGYNNKKERDFMAIRDGAIDLTEDSKFGRAPIDFETREISELSALISRIPWFSRRISREELLRDVRPKRSYGDPLSDEMGFIVRRTSDNTYLLGDYTATKKPWFWNVLDETIYECTLGKPIYSICPRCGKLMITKESFVVCANCRMSLEYDKTLERVFPKKTHTKYIAWNDSDLMTSITSNLNQRNVGFKTPTKIIRELLEGGI